MSREAVYQALFNLLKDTHGIKTASRRPRLWNEVDPVDQPALFLAVDDQVPTNSPDGEPTVWRFTAEAILYAHSTDPDVPPSMLLNPILDAIEAKLRGLYPGRPQTLGGLVERVWISGPIETSGDRLGDQGVASIPLEVLTTTA